MNLKKQLLEKKFFEGMKDEGDSRIMSTSNDKQKCQVFMK